MNIFDILMMEQNVSVFVAEFCKPISNQSLRFYLLLQQTFTLETDKAYNKVCKTIAHIIITRDSRFQFFRFRFRDCLVLEPGGSDTSSETVQV